MPTRDELLTRNRQTKQVELERATQEGCIIAALPKDLDYEDVFTSRKQVEDRLADAHGVVKMCVQGYEDLTNLLDGKLHPVPLARITQVERGTRSFYPLARIPRRWHDNDNFAIAEIEPVMWHMRPRLTPRYGLNGVATEAQITVEWFALLSGNYFVNVRATVKEHSCLYSREGLGLPWRAHNVPSGQIRRTNVPDGPPFIVVYWDLSSFNEEYTVVEHLAGHRREAA